MSIAQETSWGHLTAAIYFQAFPKKKTDLKTDFSILLLDTNLQRQKNKTKQEFSPNYQTRLLVKNPGPMVYELAGDW